MKRSGEIFNLFKSIEEKETISNSELEKRVNELKEELKKSIYKVVQHSGNKEKHIYLIIPNYMVGRVPRFGEIDSDALKVYSYDSRLSKFLSDYQI